MTGCHLRRDLQRLSATGRCPSLLPLQRHPQPFPGVSAPARGYSQLPRHRWSEREPAARAVNEENVLEGALGWGGPASQDNVELKAIKVV